MQAQLSGEQLSLASIFSPQPVPTAAAQQASEEREEEIKADILPLIAEKKERIAELKEEIGDDEEALLNAEEDELDAEPDEGEEVIFDAVAPMLEEDLGYTKYENEEEIKTIEEEIAELEAVLK